MMFASRYMNDVRLLWNETDETVPPKNGGRNEDRRITVTDCDTYDYFEELMKVRRVAAID